MPQATKPKAQIPLIAIIHNVRSLHNVGSMFRTADGVGVSKIYCTGFTPGPLDRFGHVRPEIAKVALGAEASVLWECVASLSSLLRKFKKENFLVCALEQHEDSIAYDDVRSIQKKMKNKKGVVLLVGNEVRGLSKSILKNVDCVLEIPMRGTKESLNVSVAFGIVAYVLVSAKMR